MSGIEQDGIRGWSEPARRTSSKGPKRRGVVNQRPSRWPKSPWVLVFDCETSVDDAQSLNFLVFRVCRWEADGRLARHHEGLAYGDDLAARDPAGLRAIQRYAHRHDLSFMSSTQFIEQVFYEFAYESRALVVCFNAPFDLSRLAIEWGDAHKNMRGGFSFQFASWVSPDGTVQKHQYVPRLRIKHMNSKWPMMRFGRIRETDRPDLIPDDSLDGRPDERYTFPGNFLDLRTPVWALTNRAHSLKTAAEAFNTEHRKSDADEHGRITSRYIAYARNDVLVTAEVLGKVREEYDKHPINLSITQAVSPASLAKAYLDAMGIEPVLRRQARYSRDILGIGAQRLPEGGHRLAFAGK